MDNVIDTLQIEIATQSTDAETGINKLVKTLNTLKNISSKASGVDKKGVSSIHSLAKAVDVLSKAGEGAGVNKVISNLKQLCKLDFSNLNGAKEAMQGISDLVNSVSGGPVVSFDESVFDDIADKATEGTKQINESTEKMGSAVKEAKEKISEKIPKIEINVDSVIKATSELDLLKMKLTDIKNKLSDAYQPDSKASLTYIADLIANAKKFEIQIENLERASSGNKISDFFKKISVNAKESTKRFGDFFRSLKRIAMYRAIRSMLSAISQGFKEGTANAYQYSKAVGTSLAPALDSISTSFFYFKNSIGAAVAPLIELFAPAIDATVDKLVNLINTINQSFAIITGKSTWTKAIKVPTEYAEATESATKANEELKKSLLGFDEITKLDSPSSSSDQTDYSVMFQEVSMSNAIISEVKNTIAKIMTIIAGALIVIGVILVLTGANIPLGLGLMVAGAALLAKTISVNWGEMSDSLKGVLTTILAMLGGFLLVLGAILTFTGASIGLGIALMIAGAVALATAVAINWGSTENQVQTAVTTIAGIIGGALLALGILFVITGAGVGLGIALLLAGAATIASVVALNWGSTGEQVNEKISYITAIVSVALLALGMILLLSGAGTLLGVALLLAGAAVLATTIAVNWNSMSDQLRKTLTAISAIVGGALLVLGAILVFTGVGIPLGIALMVAGVALLATAVALNWNSIKNSIKSVLASILAIVSGAAIVLGVLLCLTGAGIPLGIGLIIAGYKGVQKAESISSTAITKKVKEIVNSIINLVEKGINKCISLLNNFSIELPQIISDITGWSSIGFSISPVSIPRLAEGGTLSSGQLFIANEAGPELVGNYGNQTAVMNNDQIVESVARGVADANSVQNALLREQNTILRAILEKEGTGGSRGSMGDVFEYANTKLRQNGMSPMRT